ncbi:MAG: exo-alpha-sialidase [Calditrichaeota bacterium]|nr:exo-alpha-sialidase [Calditrichota bacterium]
MPKSLKEKNHAVILEEFVFQNPPTPACHASTIAEAPEGLVAAWFGGREEGAPDVDIWVSRKAGNRWSRPVDAASGKAADGNRYPCWNPVLFQVPGGELLLFYKVGPNPREWWGMLKKSSDGGRTWGPAKRLPEGILGPVKDKPLLLPDGRLLCGSSEELGGWRVHMEWTPDFGKTWQRTPDLNDPKKVMAIQPTLLRYTAGRLQILCRTKSKRIYQSWSNDQGKTWSPLAPTDVPNPSSGIDAVTLKDGRQLLVYNPTVRNRVPLSVAISRDGEHWQRVFDLEPVTDPKKANREEYSYPAVIQTSDGLVHVTYTWNRVKIKHVVIDPEKISE